LYANGITPESGRTQLIEVPSVRPVLKPLDLGLLRDLERVVYLDPKVSNCAFQLARIRLTQAERGLRGGGAAKVFA
jgi:hypothetical protein